MEILKERNFRRNEEEKWNLLNPIKIKYFPKNLER